MDTLTTKQDLSIRLVLSAFTTLLALVVDGLIFPKRKWPSRIKLHGYSDRQCKSESQLGKAHRITFGQYRSYENPPQRVRLTVGEVGWLGRGRREMGLL